MFSCAGDQYCNVPQCSYDGFDCIQLCLAEDFEESDCSVELLENEDCDSGCWNPYCSGYNYLSSFETPHVYMEGNDTFYSSDSLQCPTNYSLISDSNCAESSTLSVYMDPNVPDAHYGPCEDSWRGDGYC